VQFEALGAARFYIEGYDEVYLLLTCKCFNFFKSQNRQKKSKTFRLFPNSGFAAGSTFFYKKARKMKEFFIVCHLKKKGAS